MPETKRNVKPKHTQKEREHDRPKALDTITSVPQPPLLLSGTLTKSVQKINEVVLVYLYNASVERGVPDLCVTLGLCFYERESEFTVRYDDMSQLVVQEI